MTKAFDVLTPLERYTLLLFAFLPKEHRPLGLYKVMRAHVKGGDSASVERLCRKLADRGYLARTNSYWSGFELARPIPVEDLRVIAAQADRGDWWPTPHEIAEEVQDGSLNRHAAGAGDFDVALMELLQFLWLGEARTTKRLVASLRDDDVENALLRAAAFATVQVLADEPDWFPSLWNSAHDEFLACWLNIAFIRGRSVGRTMAFIADRLKDDHWLSKRLNAAYAVMALWRGETDRLDAPRLSRDDLLSKALALAAQGDFVAADKLACRYLNLGMADRLRSTIDFDNYPERLLCAMLCLAAKPDKVPKTRPVQLLRGGLYGSTHAVHAAEREYRTLVMHCSETLAEKWKESLLGEGKYLRELETDEFDSDLLGPEALIMAWDYRNLSHGRSPFRERTERLARQARAAAETGYATLATMILGLTHGGYDESLYPDLLARMNESHLTFFSPAAAAPEWQGFVKALDRALGSASASVAVPRQRLVWYVQLSKNADGTYELLALYPALRREGDPEDGSKDRVYEGYSFKAEKFREAMTERDRLIASRLAADYYADDGEPDLVRELVGLPNLYRYDGSTHYDYNDFGDRTERHEVFPLEIRPGRLALEATTHEDGGLHVALPEWLHDEPRDAVFLHKLDERTFEFVELTRRTRKVLSVLRDFGDRGGVTLPAEALPTAEKTLGRLGELLPFSEAVPAGEGASALPRVAAATTFVVQIAFNDGILHLHPVIRPLADNPRMTFDPGVGQAEKMIVGAVRSYVLVRDLAAEAAAFAPVAKALEGAANWFDGQSRWTIDDLPAALGALSALKAVTPALTLEWQEGRRLNVTNAPKSGVTLRSTRTAEDWFRVEGDFKLDDGRVLGIMELVEAMANRAGDYVRLSDGDYVALTQAMQRQIAALTCAARRKGDGLEVVKAAVPMLDGVFGEGADSLALPPAMAATAEEIRAAFAKRPQPPVTLNAELRPYQRDGYRWLSRLAACGFGACLADDMGLGKTVQVIALLLERAANGASLVFAPSSVCGNWRRELRRFAPTLNPLLPQEDLGCLAKAGARDVVIASYGFLLFHEEAFAQVAWNGVVLDEAQAIKNDASKRAKAVKRLRARFRVAATGTPVENRLGELWSLFDFLNPGLLGPAASFAARFTADGMAVPELKRLVKPLILRRLKGDVLDDLPAKTEVTLPIELGNAERTAYEAVRRRALAALEGADGEPNRMSILAELTRLRRFCCHPSLVLGTNEVPSAKLEALAGLLEELKLAGHRALVFSQFTDYLAIVRKLIAAHGWTHAYLDGSTPTLEREKLVNAFQAGEGDFFVISLKAGGTGLNLTAADYVILLDPWWNPAVENQAADRAHRIGQRRPVTVYRLIAQDTVEERVLELHKEKQAIAEDILEGTSASSLSPAQLMALFR